MATLAEQWVQQGIEQGIEQGRLQEARRQLTRVLRHRFGVLPEDFAEQIQPLTLNQLDTLLDRAMEAETLDEVLASP